MQNVAVFSYEAEEFGREGQRKYLVTTYYEFGQKYLSTKAPRHFYEVITEGSACHLYFDLEYMKEYNHQVSCDRVLETFVQYVCAQLHRRFSLCCDSTHLLILDSSTPNKFSKHIIFHLPNAVFRSNSHAGSFVFSICDDLRHLKECRDYGSRLLEQAYRHLFVDTPLKCKHPLCHGPLCEQLLSLFLKNDAGKDILICDESVYTRNRNFRLFLSSKLGKKVPLIVAKENKFKSAYGVDHEKHGKDHSPYPGVDLFIGGEIGKDGGRPGSIRRWTFFPQGKLIVYDIKDNRWCGNIGREHKSNNIMIVVDLSLGVFYQKCYDPDCRKANYRSKDHILPAEVNPVHCQMESGSRDENPGRHNNRGDDYTYLGDLSDIELDAIISDDTDGDEALPPGVCWNTCTPKAVPIEPQLCQEGQGNPPQNQRDPKGEGSPPCGQGGQRTPMGQVYQEQESDQEQSWNKLLGDHGIPIEAIESLLEEADDCSGCTAGEATPTPQNDVLNISAEEMKSFLDEADEPSPLGDQFSVSSDEIDSFFDMNPDVYQSVGAQDLLAMQEQTDVDKVVPLVETGVGTTGATPVGAVVDDVWAILLGDREHVEPDKDKSHHGEEDSKSGCDCKSDDMEQMTSSQWDSFGEQQLVLKGKDSDKEGVKVGRELDEFKGQGDTAKELIFILYQRTFPVPMFSQRTPHKVLDKEMDSVEDQEESFKTAKLTKPTILFLYDPGAETKLSSDASSYGLGTVLLQAHHGEWKLVVYASRSLTKTERQYAQIEKEALAIIWARSTPSVEPMIASELPDNPWQKGFPERLITDNGPQFASRDEHPMGLSTSQAAHIIWDQGNGQAKRAAQSLLSYRTTAMPCPCDGTRSAQGRGRLSSVLTCLPLDVGDSTDGSKHQPSTDTDAVVAPTQSQQGSSEPSLQKGSDFEGTAIIQTHPEGNQLLQLQQKASNLELENKLLKEEGGLGVVWAVLELNMTLLLRNEFYQRESQLQSEQKQLSEVVAMQQKQLSQKQDTAIPLPGPEWYTKEQTSQQSKQPPSNEAWQNVLNTSSKGTAGRVPAMVPAQPKDKVGPVDVAIANKDTGDSTDGSKHQPSTDTDSVVAPTQSQQGSSEPSLQKGSDFEGTAIIQTHPEGNQLLQLQQKASDPQCHLDGMNYTQSNCPLSPSSNMTIDTNSCISKVIKARYTIPQSNLPNIVIDNTLQWNALPSILEESSTRLFTIGVIANTVSNININDINVHEDFTDVKLFARCVQLLLTGDPCANLLSCLLCCAGLERALGDVYFTASKGKNPPMLNKLLDTQELKNEFGERVMYFLSILLANPEGLDLRNILWHGFMAPQELPKEGYIHGNVPTQVFVIVPSIPIIFHSTAVAESELDTVKNLFSCTTFILHSMLPIWLAAVKAVQEKRSGEALALLLPCMEHSLRRVFARVNGCPETAIAEILSQDLPDGSPNRLKEEIGASKLVTVGFIDMCIQLDVQNLSNEMLLDLLVHPEGPKLRNKLSHGEVDFSCVPQAFANHVLCMAITFCAQYTRQPELNKSPIVSRCLDVEKQYVSLFHPISMLRKELLQLVTNLEQWKQIPDNPDKFSITDQSESSGDAISHVLQSVSSLQNTEDAGLPSQLKACLVKGTALNPLQDLVTHLWQRPFGTLYVPRADLELVGKLRSIVSNASQSICQVTTTAAERSEQLKRKELRSRQRLNYDRLLSSVVVYHQAMVAVVLLVCDSVSQLPLDSDSGQGHIKFLEKAVSHERISNKAAYHSTYCSYIGACTRRSAERASSKTPWYTRKDMYSIRRKQRRFEQNTCNNTQLAETARNFILKQDISILSTSTQHGSCHLKLMNTALVEPLVIPSGVLPSSRSSHWTLAEPGTLAYDKTTTEPMRAERVHICTTVITKGQKEVHYDLWTIQRWQNPKGRVVTPGNEVVYGKDGKDHSPYPGVDLFIGGEIGKDGGRPGSIRRWTFFPQGKLIVYDIKDNRWCGNIGREHKSNNIMIVVDLSLGVFYQKCYDPDCRKANYRSKDHILPAEVNPVHCQMESGSRDENPGRHDNRGDDYTYLGDLSDIELDAIISDDTDGDEALPPGVCWNTCTPKAVPIEPQLCQEGGQRTPMGQVYQEQESDQEQSWNKLLGDHGIPIEAIESLLEEADDCSGCTAGEATPTPQNDVLNISAEEMKSFLDEADEPSPLGDQFSVSSDEIDSFFDMNPDVYQSVGAQGLLAMQEQTHVDKVVPLVETGVGTTGATPVGVVVDDVWAILLGDREHVEPDKDKSHHGEEDSKSGCDCKSDDMEQMTSSQWDSFVNQ
eukprot:Em0019g182a